MPTSTNVTNLKINELTEAQYDSAVQGGVIGANELSILTDVDAGQVIQVATLPTASADELGKIYQFVGTTDANYTNGYFYKCVSDGQQPATYSWSRVDVQPGGLVNTATGTNSLTVLGTPATGTSSINIGKSSLALGNFGIAIGYNAESNAAGNISIGQSAKSLSGTYGIAIGKSANIVGGCVQIAFNSANLPSNNVANTVKIANANGNFEIMSADGTIPADRLIHAINKYSTMPTASSSNEGWIVQFTGTTDSTYTHGHLYECVSDGQQPATYSWEEVSMGGGSSLPIQTGNAGKFLTTDGTDASWSDKALVNTATGSGALTLLGGPTNKMGGINIGEAARVDSNQGVAVGHFAHVSTNSACGVALGFQARITDGGQIAIGDTARAEAVGAIQIGGTTQTNSDANTLKVGNANGNFEIMSADGTIPHARLTNAVQSTTVTIATTDWSSNTASVTVSGLTATSVVWVAPDNASQSAYTTAGVYASAQAADTLTFTCTQTPSASLTINVVFC